MERIKYKLYDYKLYIPEPERRGWSKKARKQRSRWRKSQKRLEFWDPKFHVPRRRVYLKLEKILKTKVYFAPSFSKFELLRNKPVKGSMKIVD